MVTYPLDFPDVGIQVMRFAKGSITNVSESPFTATQQVARSAGEWWEGEIAFVPLTASQANLVKAFLLKCRGRFGTFLFGDPYYLANGPQGVGGGTPLVNGSSQTGNSLDVDGFPNSTTVYKAGDYFQLGSGLTSRLYCLTDDVISNGSGEATLSFEPKINTAPSDNDPLVFTGAKGLFRLADDMIEWRTNTDKVSNIVVPFRSVV